MGFSPEPAVPAHSRDRMLRKRPWVIGVDLNRCEFTAAALRDLGRPMSGMGSLEVSKCFRFAPENRGVLEGPEAQA
jgi:hypothetical protein